VVLLAAVAEVAARQHQRWLATSWLHLSAKTSHAARQHLRQRQQRWLTASRSHLAAVVLHAAVAEVAKAAKVAKLVELAKVAELAAVAEVVARQYQRWLATSWLHLSAKTSHAARQYLRQRQQR